MGMSPTVMVDILNGRGNLSLVPFQTLIHWSATWDWSLRGSAGQFGIPHAPPISLAVPGPWPSPGSTKPHPVKPGLVKDRW
ncbi:hypothetical protein [Sorangium sp. So ce381]|uniref:hypothetical protein n=1 Tax=Sorangium sp. So ce381 TaxID=3133307 RepID=UPI003F5B712E